MRWFGKKTQTLTGRQRILADQGERVSTPAAYYSKRADPEAGTGRKVARRPPKVALRAVHNYWIQRFGMLILLLAVIATVISLLSLSSQPKIVVLGSSAVPLLHATSDYQRDAQKQLASSILNGNKITVNTAAVAHQLKVKYPEINTVSITLPLIGHRPVIYIQLASPTVLLATSYGSFVVDSNGRVVLADNDQTAAAKLDLIHVTDQSGLRPRIGQQVIPASTIAFMTTVNTELRAKQLVPSFMVLPAASSELDVHLVGQSYFVKFNLQSDTARVQSGTFLATQARLSGQGITPGEYVDVRVEGRAYYK